MSRSRSPYTASYAPASSTEPGNMAEALFVPASAHLPASALPRRRTPQPLRLPPLSIPQRPLAVDPRDVDRPPSRRLPSLQSLATHSPAAPSSTTQWSKRKCSGPAVPLADLLSPQPSTPARSDVGVSPSYGSRRSPPRSYHEAPPVARYDFAQRPGSDIPSSGTRLEASYNSPVEAPSHPYRAAILSPNHTPTFAPRLDYQTPRGARQSPAGASSMSAARFRTHGVPKQPPAVAAASPPTDESEKQQLQFELHVRQQPAAARACGFGERDRRVIDPPPIIQLIVRNPLTGTVNLDEVRYSLNIVHCTLWSEDGMSEQTALQQPDRRTTRRLMGQLVASPSVAKDEHDVEGCFFCFPDLSCRTPGRYRLRFVLIRLDPAKLQVGSFSPILTEVLSDVFSVYTAKDFPGMRPSSALTRALKLQGCNIQVKKGNERALARKRQSFDSNEDKEEAERVKRWKEGA